jgi:crotonobetainyl-CoA:carnitine CoA-transferase CaiB-like acyl-CoA transferase
MSGQLPLEGLKVLDLAWVVAGPLIGRSLADYGATVVRIDSSKRVETARLMGPFPGGRFDSQSSTLYENCNAGKLGLSLDLRVEAARDVVRDLARWADVAIESFTPGQVAKWGLGYAVLSKINPSLVMVSTALMGQSGPYSGFSGYGNHGAAIAGFQNIVGPEGGPPVGPFGPYTDFVAPRFGLMALLAALDHRRRTGKGCWLDVSQSEAGMQFLAPQIADYTVTGRIQGCDGDRDPAMAPHGVFAAAGWDSWVALAARNDADWTALAELIGGEALSGDPRFTTLKARKANEDALEAIVAAWVARRPAAEAEAALQAIGVSAHIAVASEDFMADPQLNARGHFVRLPHPRMGEAVIEASRYRLSETPAQYPRAAPVYGRDNQYVLAELLGYDAARFEALVAEGAVA